MTDLELLELAAKAAGIEYTTWHQRPAQVINYGNHLRETRFWNPLADDGDALRLAVKLQLQMDLRHSLNEVAVFSARRFDEGVRGDPLAATRRAIVRAAAEIGRSMT